MLRCFTRLQARSLGRSFHTTVPRAGLLKGINPILTADLLHVLRSAGHGDDIVIVDCNFPAAQVATLTTTGKHIELAGVDTSQAVEAICALMPIDFFVDCAAEHMAPSPGVEIHPLG